jgi:hypothetical protein
MLVVMRTFGSDEFCNDRYDYAVYKLETQEAKIISRHFNLFKVMLDSQGELVEMVYSAADETACEFYPCEIWDKDELDVMPQKLREELDKKEWGILPEEFEREFTPKDAFNPVSLFLVIGPNGFYWRAFPRESGLTIETQVLPRDLLAQVL